ncbi:unnamed protein product, partial [Ectocarpus sp. 8 AP-2014]
RGLSLTLTGGCTSSEATRTRRSWCCGYASWTMCLTRLRRSRKRRTRRRRTMLRCSSTSRRTSS